MFWNFSIISIPIILGGSVLIKLIQQTPDSYVDYTLSLLHPGFAYSKILVNMTIASLCPLYNICFGEASPKLEPSDYFSMEYNMMPFFLIMMVQLIVYVGIIFVLELTRNLIMERTYHTPNTTTLQQEHTVDKDVASEEDRIMNTPCEDTLQFQKVRKEYNTGFFSRKKKLVAVEDVSFGVSKGECFALLGPNGAGKSTSLSMSIGSIGPSAGNIDILSSSSSSSSSQRKRYHPYTHEAHEITGYCPQDDILYPDITVREHLQLFAAIKGVPHSTISSFVDKMMTQVELMEHKDKNARFLSGGSKRKTSLILSIIGRPWILYLDEPTCG